jgi:hypothetical protein
MRAVVYCWIVASLAGVAQAEELGKNAAAAAPEVVASFELLEISHTKLRDLGFDFDRSKMFRRSSAARTTTIDEVMDSDAIFLQFLQSSKQNGITKTLTAPTLLTKSGSTGYFRDGGELQFPVPSGQSKNGSDKMPFGTTIQFRPTLKVDGAILCDLRFTYGSISSLPASSAIRSRHSSLPSRQFVVNWVMKPDQIYVLSCPIAQRVATLMQTGRFGRRVNAQQVSEVETFLLVRLELREPASTK